MASIEDLRLGDSLLSRGLIDEAQLAGCLRLLKDRGGSGLAAVLAERGLVTKTDCEATRAANDSRITLPSAGGGVPSVPGRAFGRYVLLQELGRGGMGVVHRAFDPTLGREVALKQLHSVGGATEGERFLHEARAAAKLNHHGIVPVYEVGDVDGVPYYTMELIQGRPLSDVLHAGLLSRREVASVVREVALAAHAAHEAGIVHRDLKPANVLVSMDEAASQNAVGRVRAVRVTDFGLAKDVSGSDLTVTGQVLGTPAYMSPEQASGLGRHADRRTDVFSLGAILYEALVGVPPFMADDAIRVLSRIRTEEPVPPRRLRADLPRDLETITLKALEKRPSARYPTAKEMAEDLDRWLGDRPVLARPVTPVGRAVRWVRRNRLKSALAVVALLAIANPIVLSWWQRRGVRAEAEGLRQAGERRVEAARAALAAPLPRTSDEFGKRRAERSLDERVSALREGASTLAQAVALDPASDAARVSLAEAYFALYEEALREARLGEAATYEALVRSTATAHQIHDRYEARFRREGRLSIATDPPGAEAWLFRCIEGDDTRLIEVPWDVRTGRARAAVLLGTTPCGPVTLPEGSWIFVLRAKGRAPVRVPVAVKAFEERTVSIAPPKEVTSGFAWVPAGEYAYPADETAPAARNEVIRIEKPFLIALEEVTQAEWSVFTAFSPGPGAEPRQGPWKCPGSKEAPSFANGRIPIMKATCTRVLEYLKWRSERDGRTYRLPTADEWEVAARGADGRWYPWGNYFAPAFSRTRLSAEQPTPGAVGSTEVDESPFGVRDLGGNAAEWTSTLWTKGTDLRVVKGGAWGWDAMYARSASRIDARESLEETHIGFRLAVDGE